MSVAILPTAVALAPGTSKPFQAAVTNSTNVAVIWSVQENGGGSITPLGVYTAPLAAGMYHVVATSAADPTKSAAATVTVSVTVSITVGIDPASKTLSVRDSQTFVATVAGTTDQAVTWSVQEGAAGGSITPLGVYTAPASPGTYHVLGTSHADPASAAVSTITVQAGSASGTIQ